MLPLSARRFGAMGRRRALAAGGGGAPDLTDAAAYLAGGWWATAFGVGYRSSSDPAGVVASPSSALVAFRVPSQPITTSRTLIQCGGVDGTTGGYHLFVNGATNVVNCRWVDAGGTLRARTLTAIATGPEIHVAVMTAPVSGAGNLRCKLDKNAWTSTAVTGYTAPAAGQKLSVGLSYPASVSAPARGVEILGFAFVDTILSDAQIDAWLDDIASQQYVTDPPGGSGATYNVKRTMSDLCARSEWAPTSGSGVSVFRDSASLNLSGAPYISRVTSPTWGYSFTPGAAYTKSGDAERADGKICLDARGPDTASDAFGDDQTWASSGRSSADFLSGGTRDLGAITSLGETLGSSPDVPLLFTIMLGTNGMGSDPLASQERIDYADLLDYLDTLYPSAQVVVSTLTPRTDDAAANTRLLAFNADLPGIWDASPQHAAGRLHRVDCFSVIDTGTDLSDGLHPNDAGYAKMAPVWAAGIGDAVAAVQGRVLWVSVGDSITVGVGSTSGSGWRDDLHALYGSGVWTP